MNRQQITDAVASQAGLSAAQAQAAVTATLEAIVKGVADGDSVSLPGFGTFDRRERSARTGRNPQTGAAIEIAATTTPGFKPAKAFKTAVAGR